MILVSCADADSIHGEMKTSQSIKETNDNRIQLWTDEETGVQYIIYHFTAPNKAGAGITPRLNADGSLYIEE